jgi:uncharacterized phage protein (TIGR02218 family)
MTIRTYSAEFQAHLDGVGTTLCYLLRIQARNGTVIAITSLDVDVLYDDGDGELTYQAAIGIDTSAMEQSSGLNVDNAQAKMLEADSGDFTDQQINAGVLDFSRFKIYEINYKDHTMGHHKIMSGTTGAITSMDGMSGLVELRGKSQQLKQNFVELYSITCRAKFGSSGVRFACNFDASTLWDSGDVASVDTEEPDRIFTATTAPAATGPNGALSFKPGVLKFLTGGNAGFKAEIEDIQGSEITLRFPTPVDIQATDTYDARPDCLKRKIEDCIGAYDNLLNFRGEPEIVQGDEASEQMPGASAPFYSVSVSIPPDPLT